MADSNPCTRILKGPVSIKANSNLPSRWTLSFLIPISRGDRSRRGVSQACPALGSQAPASPALPAGSGALQAWVTSYIRSPGHPAVASPPSGRVKESEVQPLRPNVS